MKRQSILFILVLLQVLFICIGCGSSEKSAQPLAAAAKETAVEEAAPAEASLTEASLDEISLAKAPVVVEDAVGVFEGLEDILKILLKLRPFLLIVEYILVSALAPVYGTMY